VHSTLSDATDLPTSIHSPPLYLARGQPSFCYSLLCLLQLNYQRVSTAHYSGWCNRIAEFPLHPTLSGAKILPTSLHSATLYLARRMPRFRCTLLCLLQDGSRVFTLQISGPVPGRAADEPKEDHLKWTRLFGIGIHRYPMSSGRNSDVKLATSVGKYEIKRTSLSVATELPTSIDSATLYHARGQPSFR
jgi:hypothetical protein